MSFQIPLHFCKNKQKIPESFMDDLDLDKIYKLLFKQKTILGENCIQQWNKYYTTDIAFLKDSQKIYKKLKHINIDKKIENFYNDYKEIKEEKDFLEKYQYLDIKYIKCLNRNIIFTTLLSFYNITAPVFNLALPILILILPFFLLKMGRIPITFETYKKIIFIQFKKHIIGKLFYNFKQATWNQRSYYLLSFGLYLYNIYQNCIMCYRFYYNIYKIHNYFYNLQEYLQCTIDNMISFNKTIEKYDSYKEFYMKNMIVQEQLITFYDSIKTIEFKKIHKIGVLMKYFYLLYDDIELTNALHYSFGFNGYLDTIKGLYNNTENINTIKLIQDSIPKIIMKEMYYPPLSKDKSIKNDITMGKNIIITGPNASGKTTLIKTVILNVLFAQQTGYAFCKKGKLTPFDYIHSYINIPDTMNRDSLFQAEARRCKEILDCIEKNNNKKHFCIFDELYSGTNPYEAVGSASSYLCYLNSKKNVKFMLTTHYIKICNLFKDNDNVVNLYMKTHLKKNISKYFYKLKCGISNIRGGVCVLRNLRYPKRIIRNTERILRAL